METLSPDRLGIAATTALQLAHEVQIQRYSYMSGRVIRSAFGIGATSWERFAGYWDALTLDRYMNDGGRYRYRRYSEFELDHPESPLRRLPHTAYEQPDYINRLNGGIARLFDPLENGFVTHPFFEGLLRSLGHVFDIAQGRSGRWNIRVHPYRIYAQDGSPGHPTPEGLHRDGVDYIVSMLVQRHNVIGGHTDITDASGKHLFSQTLDQPMDLLLADDAATMHQVSPVESISPFDAAYRDVLVIAYTRL